jgi:hypothetical protein
MVRTRLNRPPAWSVFAGPACLLLLSYTVVPEGTARDVLFCVLATSSAAAAVVGAGRPRSSSAASWHLMAAALLAWATGDVLATVLKHVHGEDRFPGPPDVFYLAAYPLLAASLLGRHRQARRVERDTEGLIDSAILTVGLALVSWVTLLRPGLSDATGGFADVAIALAYPVLDLVVLAVLLRVLAAQVLHQTAYRLIAVSVGVMLAADTASQLGLGGRALDLAYRAQPRPSAAAHLSHPAVPRNPRHPARPG